VPELISCLDIMKDAAAIYKANPLLGDLGEESKKESVESTVKPHPQVIGAPAVPRPEARATLRGSYSHVASRFAPTVVPRTLLK
jgi:hypothetical protein